MKNLFRHCFIFLLLFVLSSAYALDKDKWEIYHIDTDVKISFRYQNCEFLEQFNHEIIVFKIENLSNKSISVQWDTKIWYDNSCINCEQDSPEFRKNISIGAGKILESKCGEYDSFQLFSKFTDKLEDMPGVNKITMLTKFELKNLTITHE